MDTIDSRVTWTSSNKKTVNDIKESILFMFLNNWINGASIQIERINTDQTKLKNAIKELSDSLKKGGRSKKDWSKHQKRLFLDIHFFLVAIANISKVMESLKKIKSRDPKFGAIYKKYNTDLKRLRSIFRNILEHMTDGPIHGHDKKGNALKNPGDFGNLNNNNYSLFGETFNLPATFKMFEALTKDLKGWSDKEVEKFYKIK
ncbi:MAG: hypothetical protein KJI69_01190 [Patescibacteria group bacterium]|nr:hypothetical protein [Patescibacteria group bacterium]